MTTVRHRMHWPLVLHAALVCFCAVVKAGTDLRRTSFYGGSLTEEELVCRENLDPFLYLQQYLRTCVSECRHHSPNKNPRTLYWDNFLKAAVSPCLQYKRQTLYCRGEDESQCATLFFQQKRIADTAPEIDGASDTSTSLYRSTAHIRPASTPNVSPAAAIGLLILGMVLGVVLATLICLCCPTTHSYFLNCCIRRKETVRKILKHNKRKASIIREPRETLEDPGISESRLPVAEESGFSSEAIYNEPSRMSSDYDPQPITAIDTNRASNQHHGHIEDYHGGISQPNYDRMYTVVQDAHDTQENRYSTLNIDTRTQTLGEEMQTEGREAEPHAYFVLEKQEANRPLPSAPTLPQDIPVYFEPTP